MIRTNTNNPYTAIRRDLAFDVPYKSFTRALESLLGRMKTSSSRDIALDAIQPEKLREELAASAGPSDFSLFQTIDHGGLLTALGGRKVRATTYVFGNGLIAVEMTKHVPAAGLYVPLRLFVCELEPGRIAVTYDVPSAALTQFGSPEVNAVAPTLDAKVDKFLSDAAELAARDARS
jgi:hypothetical protein